MIILRVAYDNFYMFKNFEVDFTYERKSNRYLSENDRLFAGSNIKVRKNLIVMGANASGKTTFGKLLWFLESKQFYPARSDLVRYCRRPEEFKDELKNQKQKLDDKKIVLFESKRKIISRPYFTLGNVCVNDWQKKSLLTELWIKI